MFSALHTLIVGAAAMLDADPKIPMTIKRFAALGDSYATGVGAGLELDPNCWKFSDSYPAQLSRADIYNGSNPEMQFLACSGTVMRSNWVQASSRGGKKWKQIWEQIGAIENADFVTLSVGGNDIGFFNVLNGCAYRFYGPASPDCEKMLMMAKKKIKSNEFALTYNQILDAILSKNTAKSFRVFVNGYSEFFDENLTSECDIESLGYWVGYRPRLLKELRGEVNKICKGLNEKIGEIIEKRNDKRIVFVDWAPKFDSHRFCRPGGGLMDGDTWFYDATFRSANLDLIDPKMCGPESQANPGDWGAQALCAIAFTHEQYPGLQPAIPRDVQPVGGRQPFGPGDARLFHPTPEGHKAIVDTILEAWPYTAAEDWPVSNDMDNDNNDGDEDGEDEDDGWYGDVIG
ncbi:hypothetical protein LOZ50_001033 [Ophidiomyces ophidiicola]|nr:hypothetical protein LOZ50_001033 [Ophidiomyces ophidiicola]